MIDRALSSALAVLDTLADTQGAILAGESTIDEQLAVMAAILAAEDAAIAVTQRESFSFN